VMLVDGCVVALIRLSDIARRGFALSLVGQPTQRCLQQPASGIDAFRTLAWLAGMCACAR